MSAIDAAHRRNRSTEQLECFITKRNSKLLTIKDGIQPLRRKDQPLREVRQLAEQSLVERELPGRARASTPVVLVLR